MTLPDPASSDPAAASLTLKWEVVENLPSPPHGASRAAFTITNVGEEPVPTSGWSIYFSTISGARSAPGGRNGIVEHVAGPLFRVRSSAPGQIAPGESMRLLFDHPEVMVKSEKGPTGPFIVFDAAPGVALPFQSFQSTPLPRLGRLPGAPEDVSTLVAPAEIYRANAVIGDIPVRDLPPVFPRPSAYQTNPGAVQLSAHSTLTAAPGLAAEARFARSLLAPLKSNTAHASLPVRLQIGPVDTSNSPEAYRLTLDPKDGVTVQGASPAGVYYGLQSLRQLIPIGAKAAVDLSSVTIKDGPRFGFRGLALDVARNFQSKRRVLQIIDLMARVKLNRLHLHLSDDEGWRLQISTLPELTSYGAKRGYSQNQEARLPSAYGSGPGCDDPHGSGFYTQADYVQILQYAHARHIEVIPEVEMPGHARAAVKSMEYRARRLRDAGAKDWDRYLLSDPLDQSKYRSAQLYTDNVINPGMPGAYRFVREVIEEIAALHRRAGVPLKTIHVGADELPAGAWEGSEAAHGEMRRLHLKTTADLWDHFYDFVDETARANGARISGWEELGMRKSVGADPTPGKHFLGKRVTLHVWNNLDDSADLAYRLANLGYSVVLAPATNLYFDMAYNHDAAEPGHNWAGYTDLFDVFHFDPYGMAGKDQISLTSAGKSNISGLEATLFSETMRDPDRLSYMMAPRLFAMAERAWSRPEEPGDWSIFANQLGKQLLPRLDYEVAWLKYRIGPPGLTRLNGKVVANPELPGFVLRYAFDVSVPNAGSPILTGPMSAPGRITVRAFNQRGRGGRPSILESETSAPLSPSLLQERDTP